MCYTGLYEKNCNPSVFRWSGNCDLQIAGSNALAMNSYKFAGAGQFSYVQGTIFSSDAARTLIRFRCLASRLEPDNVHPGLNSERN